jgi:eukaryotic-like serine/threonine-protein kinase
MRKASSPGAVPPLGGADWRLDPGDPIAFDVAGAWCVAEVDAPGTRKADALVHLLDSGAASAKPAVEKLRALCGAHRWLRVPELIPIRGIQVFAGQTAVVSELWPGVRLADLVGTVPVPPRAAAELVASVAEGLQGLHSASAPGSLRSAGLVHGGLDTHHIMVLSDGRIGVLDGCVGVVLRELGISSADPAYIAPEVRGGGTSAAADVYAVGVLLVACLSGRLPEPLAADADGHKGGIDGILAGLFELDPKVADLIRGALAHDASSRPSARNVAAGLRSVLSRLGGRWLTAWAGEVVPPPTAARSLQSTFEAAENAAVISSPLPSTQGKKKGEIEVLRPLRKSSGRGARMKWAALRGIGAVGAGALLLLALVEGGPRLVDWAMDHDGSFDVGGEPSDDGGSETDVAPGDAAAAPPAPSDPAAEPPPDEAEDPEEPPAEAEPPEEDLEEPLAEAEPPEEAPEEPPAEEPPEELPEDLAVAELAPPPEPEVPLLSGVIDVVPPSPMPPIAPNWEKPWGADWDEVGSDKPMVEIEFVVALADQISVVCANGAKGTKLEFREARSLGAAARVSTRAGRCEVRAVGPWGVATGRVMVEESQRITCRLEYLDRLRC